MPHQVRRRVFCSTHWCAIRCAATRDCLCYGRWSECTGEWAIALPTTVSTSNAVSVPATATDGCIVDVDVVIIAAVHGCKVNTPGTIIIIIIIIFFFFFSSSSSSIIIINNNSANIICQSRCGEGPNKSLLSTSSYNSSSSFFFHDARPVLI